MSDYGLLTGLWRCCRPKVKYHGAYPSGFLLKARRALGVTDTEPVLHVCGGRARDYSKPEHGITKGTPQRGFGVNDRTLDLDPALEPDFLQDAREKLPLRKTMRHSFNSHGDYGGLRNNWEPWPGILIDRPYTEQDAEQYAPGSLVLPNLNALLKAAAGVLAPGRRVGVLDYLVPSPPADLELVALYGVMTGFNQRMRGFSVFQKREVADAAC